VRTYPNAAQGLKLLFIGEIVAIVGAILSLVPVLGPILIVGSEVLILLGLYKAGTDDQGYAPRSSSAPRTWSWAS
jgi:hypothetical protein